MGRCLLASAGVLMAASSWGWAAAGPQAAKGVELLGSFEPGGPDFVKGDGQAVKEHATHGEYTLKVESDGKGYMGIHITNGRSLRKFKEYVLFKVDVFNPQDQPVACGSPHR